MVPGDADGTALAGLSDPSYAPRPMSAPSRTATAARLATIAAALAVILTLLLGTARSPAGARAMGPLPDCRYDDILTTPRSYGDWQVTLVDTILRVPKGYVPPDLVSTAQAGLTGGGKIRAIAVDDLRAMTLAAAAAGNAIGVESAYRSYASQQDVFNSWVKRDGYEAALLFSARPGHSEHQLGLTIDFRSEPGGSPFTGSWGSTPAGKWMRVHAWEYGWLMSYPKSSTGVTCYDYEPWHFRYVGRDLAALIHESGLTPREYLWANFTTTIVPPPPPPTKVPTRTPTPTVPRSSATPSAVPSPTEALQTEPPASATPAPTVSTPAPSAAPSAATAPVATAAPAVQPVAGVAEAAAGVTALLGIVGLGAWLARRRGRSGVGL
jgi:zinc D-Ala-D-Ala carboxypeptidase